MYMYRRTYQLISNNDHRDSWSELMILDDLASEILELVPTGYRIDGKQH